MRWWLTRGRVPTLCALALATLWLGAHAARVRVESTNASLESRDAELALASERFRASFGSDDDLLLAVASPRLLEPEVMALVASLTERVARIPGVGRAFSLANAQELVAGETGALPVPLFAAGPGAAPDPARVREALERNPDLTGLFVSADRRTAGILIELEDRPGDAEARAALVAALRELVASETRGDVALHLTGVAVQKHDVSAMIARDERLLMPLAALVLAASLALFFRSALGVLLPLAVTGATVAWTLGAYDLAGLELNAITALLPPVLMVLSLAVSVHLIQAWTDGPGGDRVERVLHAVREVRFPCFFCALTTAVGFASLATSDVPAVQAFGLFAALGVLVSFAIGITLVPVGLGFAAPPTEAGRAEHRRVRQLLDWTAEVSVRRPGRVLLLFGLLTALAVAGIPRVRNNTDLVRFLSGDAPLVRDTLFVDAHLGGATALDFVVSRSDGAPLTRLGDLRRMAAFEDAIRARPEVTGVASVLAVLRQIQRATAGGPLALPAEQRALSEAFDLLEAAPDPGLVSKLVAADFGAARFHARIRSVGTAVAAPLADGLLEEGRRIFGDAYRLEAAGAFYRVAQGSNRLVASQLQSFGLAVALIAAAIAALFRSLRLVAIALAPNLMPVIWTGGLMGWLDIDLSTGTAMIASAVIGVVVDDTIHYLTGFRRAYRGDAREAVRRTTAGVGAALLMNNLVLVLGFWVGAFGSFRPTVYFSLLSGATMATALVCDLFVTPASLVLTDRHRGAPACA